MAFGSGQGASSAAQGKVVQPGLGWADSSNRVVTVLVLGVPLVLLVLFSTTTGYTFFTTAWTGSTTPSSQVPSWANVPLRGLGIAADVGFLFLLVLLAAFSEGAGALAVAILAAIWFAFLVGHGSAILQRVAPPGSLGATAGSNAGNATNAAKGA